MTYHELAQHLRLVLIGILLFVIAYQLWVARFRPSEPLLRLVAAWAGAGLLMELGRFVQHVTADHGTVDLGGRIFHTGVLALVPLGIALTHETRGVPRDRPYWVWVIGSSLAVPLAWIDGVIVSSSIREFQTPAGPILGPAPALLSPLGIPYVIAIGVYLMMVARRSTRPLHWQERLSFGVSVYGLLPALVNDWLLYSGNLVTVELAGLGLFAHIMTINVGIVSRAGELFAGLEKDIEERTAALRARERELSAALLLRRRILDSAPDPLCVLHDGRFEYVNEAAVRFFECSGTSLTASRLTDFVEEGKRPEVSQALADMALATRSSTPIALRFKTAAGNERAAEVSGLAVELDAGPRSLITVRDVTEHQMLLGRLQIADRLASVGTLAAGIAHEINNPLTFVSGNLELLRLMLDGNPSAQSTTDARESFRVLLDECSSGTSRIARIVKDLNSFAGADDERAIVDCRPILEHALKIATVAIRHRAEISRDFEDCPLVSCEPRRLGQVFLNLLVNALQSLPETGGSQCIHVATYRRPDGWAVVEITDTGSGIDPALLPTVFDPFVTTKPVGQGTGLGLFICHRIVTDLGGDIRLLPGQPNGTTARVALPPAESNRPTTAVADRPAPSAALPRLRVLLVDDEELVLRTLARLLARHDVTAVASGRAALDALAEMTFDVVLCDLMMPLCSGMEVWDHAVQLGLRDRFVLMTGGATTDVSRAFVERTGVRCLHKPPSFEDIERALRSCLTAPRTMVHATGASPTADPAADPRRPALRDDVVAGSSTR
jgi:PAS domain S-box-containing protein